MVAGHGDAVALRRLGARGLQLFLAGTRRTTTERERQPTASRPNGREKLPVRSSSQPTSGAPSIVPISETKVTSPIAAPGLVGSAADAVLNTAE